MKLLETSQTEGCCCMCCGQKKGTAEDGRRSIYWEYNIDWKSKAEMRMVYSSEEYKPEDGRWF